MAAAEVLAPAKFKLSKRGYDDLVHHEGNRLAVYDDKTGKPINSYEEARGYPTIGLGIQIDTPEEREKFRPYLGGRKADPALIEAANRENIARFENDLNRKLAGAKLTQSMFDALFSLAWNTGAARQCVKNAISAILAEDYPAAQAAIATGPQSSKGVKLAGLVKRRGAEALRFMEDGLPGGAATLLKSKSLMIVGAVSLSVILLMFVTSRGRRRKGR